MNYIWFLINFQNYLNKVKSLTQPYLLDDKNKIISAIEKINQDPEYQANLKGMSFEPGDNFTKGSSWVRSQYQHYDAIRQKLKIEKLD